MTLAQVMTDLQTMASPQTKKVFLNHGANEPLFGVKVGDLKKLVKKIKKNHELSLKLFDTGNMDAMYLGALIADEKQITRKQLQGWAKKAMWYMISEYSVAWVASESRYGWELGLDWIEAKEENVASTGWATLSNFVSITPDDQLDTQKLTQLLDRVKKQIHTQPNRVRYTMNGFVISTGVHVADLNKKSLEVAEKIGKVSVDVGGTACKVPLATDYIKKTVNAGRLGRKRKMARC
jgi:3-methyladenine DNA glycosylase AlkD